MNRNQDVTILLVEDDEIDAMGIERSFKKADLTNKIIRANDGIEALELLRTNSVNSPYIVLLDLNMPRMNGKEFLEAIRADEHLKKSVVFVLTTSDDEKDIVESYNKQVAGYFVKGELEDNHKELIEMLEKFWSLTRFPLTQEQALKGS